MKYFATSLLTEIKVNFIFPQDKFLIYSRWAQRRDETYFVFGEKVKIIGVLEINFRYYFVPFMARDPQNFWAKSCKNMINLAIRTKQCNKNILYYAIYGK